MRASPQPSTITFPDHLEDKDLSFSEDISCPVCTGKRLRIIGPILHPKPTLVAGVAVDLNDDYSLVDCPHCQFQFKFPKIPQSLLLKCYEKADSHQWTEGGQPPRQAERLRTLVERYATGPDVLDVGCFDGSLLEHIRSGSQSRAFNIYGIEPSLSASAVASTNGVDILGRTLQDVKDARQFDVVLAIDVLEHLTDPSEFVAQVSRLLKRDGVFVAMTGDTASPMWKLQKSYYWYCNLPEHIGFFCKKTMQYLGEKHGLEIDHFERLSHRRFPYSSRVSALLKHGVFCVLGAPARRLGLLQRRGPTAVAVKDHFVVVMRRCSSPAELR